MVDDPDAHGADARHFETCAECQARYKTVADDARAITNLLAAPELKVDVASAFNRVRTAPAARPRFGFRLPVFRPGSRPMTLAFAAAVAAVALLATAIAQDKNTFTPNAHARPGDDGRHAVALAAQRVRDRLVDEAAAAADRHQRRGGTDRSLA